MPKTKKRKKKQSRSRSDSAKYRKLVLTRATETLLGCKVTGIEYPGGRSRESYRMLLEGADSIIATRRDKLSRARVEVQTLKALNKHDTPVPRLLGTNHSHILLQEEIRGVRLSQTLKDANEELCQQLLSSALTSLAQVHQAATAEQLEAWVDTLGDEKNWIREFIRRPRVIGKYLGVATPTLDKTALVDLLRVDIPRFIKWDSRPGNALVNAESEVIWFDWEHAGKRNRLDDMAWVLTDEFVPDYPEMEHTLIEQYLPDYSDQRSLTEAHEYLMAYGSFHMVIRLGLILKHMDGKWWDLDYCIDGDKVGVTLLCAQRLCQRGSRWSRQCPLTQTLSDWFLEIKAKIEALEKH